MKRIFPAGMAMMFCLLSTQSLLAGPIPGFMNGNWMSTDGAYRFVLGISSRVASYKDRNWQILSADQVPGQTPGHWQLHLQHDSAAIILDLYRKDSSILLMDGNQQYTLTTARNYDYRYRAKQAAIATPVFSSGNAQLEGFVQPAAASKPGGYVIISYQNSMTGEKDYFFAGLDSLGRFSVSVPLGRPQLCTLNVDGEEAAVFLAQPRDTILLAYNRGIGIDRNNPDYGKLGQRIALMGDGAAFNNQYQHFRFYAPSLGYPAFDMPAAAKNTPAKAKGPEPFSYYGDLYARTITAVDRVYPSSRVGQELNGFVRAEIRFACARALLNSLRGYYGEKNDASDSIRLLQVYEKYLAEDGAAALLHDKYYELAKLYGSKLNDIRYGQRRSYRFSMEMFDARMKNDYSLLLSPDFMQQYTAVMKDNALSMGMSDSAVIAKYFHGDRKEAVAFRYIMEKISNEFFKESRDSSAYLVYASIPNPVLHFAANLQQLNNNYLGDDEVKVASLYRLNIFKYYSAIPGMPWQQTDSVNLRRTVQLGLASILLRGDDQRITQVDHEADWQAVVRRYKGKVVVAWTFSHYFDKERAARGLYALQKMKERYRGKDVVFLKCIQQRHRNDKIRQLTEYLKLFAEQKDLDNIIYVESGITIHSMLSEAVDDCCVIYDETGRPHHPLFAKRYSERSNLTLIDELDSVMTGHGKYFNENYFLDLHRRRGYAGDATPGAGGRTWTLYDTTGNYFTYISREPERPSAEYHDYDSVFHQLLIANDSLWVEKDMILHREPARRDKNSFFSLAEYSKEYALTARMYGFRFGGPEKRLQVYDGRQKLYRQFRLAYISNEMMVLELVQ